MGTRTATQVNCDAPVEWVRAHGPNLERLPKPGPWWVVWLLWLTILGSPLVSTPWLILSQDYTTDFQELYGNGWWALETGRLTYQSMRFYPPSAMPVFMAFALLPPWVATFTTCGVYAFLYLLAIRHLPAEAMRIHPAQKWHAWLALALVAGGFICYDVVTGQVSGIPVFAMVMGFVWWRRGWTLRASAALSIGIAFKLLPGACVLFFLVKRQWKMVWATGLFTLVLMFLPGLLIFGPDGVAEGWREYHTHVYYPKSHPVEYPGEIRWTKPAHWLNPALSITLLRWFSDYPQDEKTPFLPMAHLRQEHVQWAYRALVAAMGVMTLWLCRRRRGPDPPRSLAAQYGLLITWMILLSPHLAPYYMAWALWPVAVMIGQVAWRDLHEWRTDRVNLLLLWIYALSFPLCGLSVLRGAGLHPAVLLLMWGVMAWNVVLRRSPLPHDPAT